LQDNGTPPNWYTAAFDDSSWVTPTQYTAAEAGWGRAPSWTGGQCCTVTSPADRSNVGCNVDPITGASITVTEDQCIDPQTVLNGVGAPNPNPNLNPNPNPNPNPNQTRTRTRTRILTLTRTEP
jgi:hypothetical protein